MHDVPPCSRRGFLKTVGFGAAAAALSAGSPGPCARTSAAERPAPEGEKGRRSEPPGKPASWIIACRDSNLKSLGRSSTWDAMKELGLGGVEVEVNEDLLCYSLVHPGREYRLAGGGGDGGSGEGIRQLRGDLEERGFQLTAFCMHNRLQGRLEEEVAWARRLVAAAKELGVETIRIDVVPRDKRTTPEEFLPFAVKASRQLCDLVEGSPIRLGIENHGTVTNDPSFLERLFDGVGSEHLGLTLDTGNFYWFGHPLDDVYRLYEKFAPRAFHTHIKSIAYPEERRNVRRPMGWEYGKYASPIHQGDIDFRRVIGILERAGYRGDLCLEDEALARFAEGERAGVLRREVEHLRAIVGRGETKSD